MEKLEGLIARRSALGQEVRHFFFRRRFPAVSSTGSVQTCTERGRWGGGGGVEFLPLNPVFAPSCLDFAYSWHFAGRCDHAGAKICSTDAVNAKQRQLHEMRKSRPIPPLLGNRANRCVCRLVACAKSVCCLP